MVADAESRKRQLLALNEQDGPAFKIKEDPRVRDWADSCGTPASTSCRNCGTCCAGEMSLVGPRPLPCDETAACRGWLRRRLDMTPGLTCLWQVQGGPRFFCRMGSHGVRYIRSRTLSGDVKLLLQTVPPSSFGKERRSNVPPTDSTPTPPASAPVVLCVQPVRGSEAGIGWQRADPFGETFRHLGDLRTARVCR